MVTEETREQTHEEILQVFRDVAEPYGFDMEGIEWEDVKDDVARIEGEVTVEKLEQLLNPIDEDGEVDGSLTDEDGRVIAWWPRITSNAGKRERATALEEDLKKPIFPSRNADGSFSLSDVGTEQLERSLKAGRKFVPKDKNGKTLDIYEIVIVE